MPRDVAARRLTALSLPTPRSTTILASLENRALRERVYIASIHRNDGTGAYAFPIVVEIARLRAEKAELMGFKDYASYSLENTMAKNTANAYLRYSLRLTNQRLKPRQGYRRLCKAD